MTKIWHFDLFFRVCWKNSLIQRKSFVFRGNVCNSDKKNDKNWKLFKTKNYDEITNIPSILLISSKQRGIFSVLFHIIIFATTKLAEVNLFLDLYIFLLWQFQFHNITRDSNLRFSFSSHKGKIALEGKLGGHQRKWCRFNFYHFLKSQQLTFSSDSWAFEGNKQIIFFVHPHIWSTIEGQSRSAAILNLVMFARFRFSHNMIHFHMISALWTAWRDTRFECISLITLNQRPTKSRASFAS